MLISNFDDFSNSVLQMFTSNNLSRFFCFEDIKSTATTRVHLKQHPFWHHNSSKVLNVQPIASTSQLLISPPSSVKPLSILPITSFSLSTLSSNNIDQKIHPDQLAKQKAFSSSQLRLLLQSFNNCNQQAVMLECFTFLLQLNLNFFSLHFRAQPKRCEEHNVILHGHT